ncbi:hypothetical protein P3T73_01700 [Kiritimatiellota bacterium B12222]|nr:hypothetical protein P3T73_01700 [Kiritimatiellota bacterium B12222]
MNLSSFVLSLLCVFSLNLVSAEADTEKITLVRFDEKPLEFLYGSWKGQMSSSDNGILIHGAATAKGGGGDSVSLDLSDVHGLALCFRILPENKASGINVILYSEEGHASGYSFSLKNGPTNATTMIVALNKPFFRPADAPEGYVNLSAITKFQIQGNYQDAAPLAVELIRLEAVPAPSIP